MDDLNSSQIDAVAGRFSLIDASISDDDFLLPSSSSSELNTVDSQSDAILAEAQMGEPAPLLAVQRPQKTGKCNLRKSLAWDSAFFTSDGVLDAEELTNIHEGDHLPSIQEDLSKSTDSISTFQSESLTLDSLEADLFSDIRASIQRNSKSSPAGSYSGDGEFGNGHSMKKVHPSSGSIVKSKSSSKKIYPAGQEPLRLSKPGSISKKVTKPSVRTRESSSSLLRAPIANRKPSLEGAPLNRRMSVAASRLENMKGTAKGSLIPKIPRQDSRNTVQKTLASSKPCSASSTMNRSALRSSQSSCESSCSSSDNIRKSLPGVRRKIEKTASLPSGSKVQTPSRAPMKSNSRIGESKLSTSQLSPNISPASSISEWSTESSSSTATVNQKHSCLKQGLSTEDAITYSNVSQNIPKDSTDRSLEGNNNQVASTLSQSVKQPSAGTATSLVRSGSAKPSGLRLPSPKIGFFDGVKAGTKTPSGSARGRSTVPSGSLAKSAGNCSPSRTANKVKLSSDAAKVAIRPGSAKLGTGNINASPKSTVQLQGHSAGAHNSNSKNDSGSSSASQKTKYAKSCVEKNSIVAEVANGRNLVYDSISEVEDHSTYRQNESSAELGGVEAKMLTPAARMRETPAPGPEKINASPKSIARLQGHSVGLSNISSSKKDSVSSSASLTANYAKSAGETKSIVAEAADEGEHVTYSGSEVKDHSIYLQNEPSLKTVDDKPSTSIVLPESFSPKSAVLGNIKVAHEAVEMEHVGNFGVRTKDLSGVMLQASQGENFDDGPSHNVELLKFSSPKSAFVRTGNVAEVADGGRSFGSVFKDDFGVSEMEASKEGKQLTDKPSDVADSGVVVMCATDCLKTLSSTPASAAHLCYSTGNNVTGDCSSFQDVKDVANLYARQGDIMLAPVKENPVSGNAVLETKENVHAENQADELKRHRETRDSASVVQSTSPSNFESETTLKNEVNSSASSPEDFRNCIQSETTHVPCSLPLPAFSTISERTPFAVKTVYLM